MESEIMAYNFISVSWNTKCDLFHGIIAYKTLKVCTKYHVLSDNCSTQLNLYIGHKLELIKS